MPFFEQSFDSGLQHLPCKKMIDKTIKLQDHLNKEAIAPIISLLNSINIVIFYPTMAGHLVKVEEHICHPDE